ncbi:MAG TPA: cobalamin-dependent protein, partial [Acidimicrobiia bacterium]|nr:cobalamin-dependent protein [Acidimicrobiia bacterium]
MRVLLVSTYELGHQPINLAAPAAALAAAGHEVRTLDTSVEPWSGELVAWADAVAFSVPMHTAMRLALRAAAAVRAARPELPICLYGLYATVSR